MLPVLVLLFSAALVAVAAVPQTPIDEAFQRLYNFEFRSAHTILDAHLKSKPSDPLAHAVRASAVLFEELHRLRILESEFFAEDKRIVAKQALRPAPEARAMFDSALRTAEREAQNVLVGKPNDADALFTLSLVAGLQADYLAFIEKRQWQSLSYIKQSQTQSLRLLRAHPNYTDGELTGGACEYLLGSMPFFVKWFIRFDGVEGQKSAAAVKLERVAASGRYLGPFARILLAIVHIREKQPTQAFTVLDQLSKDFPANPLFREEARKVGARIGRP
ncbi:MAG TPA: hypothetical protein VER03_05180 [Bryobacteraceae bacterium]|nr:hypothetical protein [Bryobacteraceae bacterium]